MTRLFLLVDDDCDDAELFGEALSLVEPTIDFYHAPDGKSAFKYLGSLTNKRPDLIFLDLNMPEMSGWQCLARLKNDHLLKDIPVVMYSTSSHQRDKEIAIELGAIGFITKPSDYKALQGTLKRIASAPDMQIEKLI